MRCQWQLRTARCREVRAACSRRIQTAGGIRGYDVLQQAPWGFLSRSGSLERGCPPFAHRSFVTWGPSPWTKRGQPARHCARLEGVSETVEVEAACRTTSLDYPGWAPRGFLPRSTDVDASMREALTGYSWVRPMRSIYVVKVRSREERDEIAESLMDEAEASEKEGLADVRLMVGPAMRHGNGYDGYLPGDVWSKVNARTG